MRSLLTYEVETAAEYEIRHTISTLRGMRQEIGNIAPCRKTLHIATFFPLNLPLYSLALFALAPAAFAQRVYVRPSAVMAPVVRGLMDRLGIEELFPELVLRPASRSAFAELYADDADVLIFTGRYENALALYDRCPDSLLLYNGSGVNPFVLARDANVEEAADRAVEMRCFNSGQDCAGPDAFFVPDGLIKQFEAALVARLQNLTVSHELAPGVDIGPLQRTEYARRVDGLLSARASNVRWGGAVELGKSLVHPTVIAASAQEHLGPYHEFFAPVFNLLGYGTDDELREVITRPAFVDRAMYASVFGALRDDIFSELRKTCTVLDGAIVNDVEDGNNEYGGWGTNANFILWEGHRAVRPLLISREISNWLGQVATNAP